ncbi:hypothetical protein F441_20945 [Phytophthora nicotianae CJ01A1]|uniref:Uncharacterized protein n=1 Tax=Phytophthora nicotianae CJ01A1 TaxID=1317063 RepID=W2VUD1_PHYNI|nr:hypothetical protein F441_20945 [Phytophthora nicotianae CJ01A1]
MNWPEAAVTKYAALNAEQWEETMNCGRTVAASNTVSSTIPDDAIESTVQSSGGSHSTPLMIGMIVLVCVAVMVTVGLALYVRRRKKQIDSYKRREEQGTEMSDADVSPRASDVSGYDMSSISIKGVNGEVLEETLSLSADECTEGSKQFSTSDVTQFTTVAGSSSPSPPTTSNPTTAPTLAPTITPESTPAATPTPTPIATSNATYNPVTPTTDSSSFISSSSSSDSTDHDVGADSAAQESGSNTVQETVAASNTVSSTIPDDAIESTVQSSGGSHSTPLMIGMIVLVCVAVMVTVGLALYVRRRKKQIDSYKRREEQGTEMSDADVSPRASDVSAYDMVHSPTVHFSSMESMGSRA